MNFKTFAVLALLFVASCSPVIYAEILPDRVPDNNQPLDEGVLFRLDSICHTNNWGENEKYGGRIDRCRCIHNFFSNWTNLQFKKYSYEIVPKTLHGDKLTAMEQAQFESVERMKNECPAFKAK